MKRDSNSSFSLKMRMYLKRSGPAKVALFACVCLVLYFALRQQLFKEKFANYSSKPDVNTPDTKPLQNLITKNQPKKKVLLIYSTWFGMPRWGVWNQDLLDKEFPKCFGSKNCVATYDKGRLAEADGVLFHGRDVESRRADIYSAANLLKARNTNGNYAQKWIFLAHETPQRAASIYSPYDGFFNWTATYNRNSDVYAPYGQYTRIEPPQPITVNYAKTKKYLAAWPVSNCFVQLRLNYALELQKHIPLTVYGGCGKFFKNKGECPRRNKDCHDRLGLYKFYFAFENEFCRDWMTEKYWRAITVESVPVVMGENFEGLAIPGSYIDVNKFPSIKALAEYLLHLDKNDDEYNKYFAYKSTYKEAGISFFCAMCDKLNSEEFEKKTQVKLSERYGFETTCHQDPQRIRDLERQVAESRNGR